MISAGWYADPEDPKLLRYWDGSAWTEFSQPIDRVNDANTSTPTDAVGGASGQSLEIPDDFSPVFDWLGRSAKVPFQRFAESFLFFFLSPLLTICIGAVIISSGVDWDALDSFQGNSFDTVEFDPETGRVIEPAELEDESQPYTFEDFLATSWWRIAIAIALQVLVIVPRLVGSHQFLAAHKGEKVPIGTSVKAAINRFPKALAIYFLMSLLALIVFGPAFLALLVAGRGAMGAVGLLVGLVWLMTVGLVVAVKFSTIEVALVSVPDGTSALSTAMNISKNRFWKIAGRKAALIASLGVGQVVVWVLLFIFMCCFSSFLGILLFGVGGSTPLATILPAVLMAQLQLSFLQIFWTSGAAGLYADAQGPTQFAGLGSE